MDSKYSWVDTHKELTKYLSTKENSQQELIALLKSVGISPFNDKSKEGDYDVELNEIDPFTFLCYIHKYGDKRRLNYLQQIAEKLNIKKPLGVVGIPTSQPQKVWMFPSQYLRTNNEVARLWSLFKKELKGEVADEDFADVLKIKNVGDAKLTEVLFYINPEKYLPINGPTKPYIKEVLGLNTKFTSYSEYIDLLSKIREKIDIPFYELSHKAWKWNKERNNVNNKVIPASSDDPILLMIENYKKHIAQTQLKDEIYKWELIEKYKGRPNLDADNLLQEIKSVDYSNLMYAMGKAVLNRLASERTEGLRELLENLFDESKDLTERVKAFNKQSLKLYREMESKLGHHQDERSISAYLTFRNPEKYTFYKYAFYNNYCKLLGIKQAKKNEKYTHYLTLIDELTENYIISDKELIELVKSYIPQYYDGSNHKLLAQDILYQMLDKNAEMPVSTTSKTNEQLYWLYSPGENAHNWEEFYNDGIMAIGWDKIGDIRQYTNRKQIQKALVDKYGGEGSKKNDVSANDDFLNKMKVGDVVIVKKGRTELLGYGIVTSDYIYDDAREENINLRKVDWKLRGRWEINHPMITKTLTDITTYATDDPNYNTYYERLLGIMKEEMSEKITTSKMNYPLNTIFYGPPGTGKTYNTVLRAAEIIEDRVIENYYDAIKIFNDNLHDQIEFITFHQNYSYEDFVQGLRPDTDDNEVLTFEKRDGIFKKIADRALKNLKDEVKKKNYVIIIDEINRANISRVFGELITLIEVDKRSHGQIPLETKLPSGDKFMVPSNLYIIGTMNTADKSIALLDIALRRRFEFEAMYPLYDIKDKTINDAEILKKLNDRIIETKGHDFQIGHSFFMGSNGDTYDLNKTMNNKVIPLLLEYYMNDEKEVKGILLTAGLTIEENAWPLRITGKNDKSI